jgi:hypothetical protein
MNDLDRLAALLVTDHPRQAADKTVAYLLAHLQAKAGAVLTHQQPSLFIARTEPVA